MPFFVKNIFPAYEYCNRIEFATKNEQSEKAWALHIPSSLKSCVNDLISFISSFGYLSVRKNFATMKKKQIVRIIIKVEIIIKSLKVDEKIPFEFGDLWSVNYIVIICSRFLYNQRLIVYQTSLLNINPKSNTLQTFIFK